MKFSIAFLLVLLVLAAAIANKIHVRQTIDELDAKIENNRLSVLELQDQLGQAEDFKTLYEQAIAGEQKLIKKYRAAYKTHQDLPREFGELELGDGTKILMRRVPLVREGTLYRYAFRVHAPEGVPLNVALQFSGDTEFLLETTDEPCTRLPSGESTIGVTFDFSEPNQIQFLVNNETFWFTRMSKKPTGYSTSFGVSNNIQTERSDLRGPFALAELRVGNPEFKLVIELVLRKDSSNE